jgi:dTDP-4-dehydrorhamnose reductase
MKILVTGSNGLLGQKLVHQLSADADVELVATARGENRLEHRENYSYRSLDITNPQEVERVISEEKPAILINTAAMTNVDACEGDKPGCDALNVDAVQYIVKACEANNVHLVHLSTDFIFDGAEGPLDENAVPNPVSYYGESKLKAEEIIQASGLKYAILRTVLVYGVADESL